MTQDRMEGKAKEATGYAKDKAGEFTGNERLESEGEAERTEGKAQGAMGKAKEAVGDAVDSVKSAFGKD
jgi:uncharacterized protein YjbJ (UPF0337 family)